MTDTKRTIAAGLLIGLLTLFIPFYLNFIGIAPDNSSPDELGEQVEFSSAPDSLPVFSSSEVAPASRYEKTESVAQAGFEVITDQYRAFVSNAGGGSIQSFQLIGAGDDGYKYLGGYDDFGQFQKNISVDLALPINGGCNPCLAKNDDLLFDAPFSVISDNVANGRQVNLYGADSLVVEMETTEGEYRIKKKTTFFADSYLIRHDFYTTSSGGENNNFTVLWNDGLRTTEKNIAEEITYSQGYLAQSKEIHSIALSPSSIEDREAKQSFSGKTDWVAIRNKYFINSLIAEDAIGGSFSGRSYRLNENTLIPAYTMGLNFNNKNIHVRQFFGPLDVDIIASSKTYLDRVMNFGWLPIQPFSRSVLWILTKLHLLGINYGLILILFAFMIRIITGPLTKKSYQSTQKMQTVQPELKKIQEKYKNDSQRLNKEMMNLYKKHGVNPLGGCLPMLIQMPLLFSLFIVFRSTIEFRGAPFFGWISNLSQPDTIFNLPFYVPIYGDQVALLPFVLGISMFMSQRLSMATMDKSQKPMMYIMSGFFFLLFNSFPSGLNLYYTVYNILNYFQQKSIKAK